MPGDDQGAALLVCRGNRQIEDLIETLNNARDVAALREIDHRIGRGHEEIAGADDVRAPEKYQAVTVGVRVRGVERLDPLVVEVELFPVEERVGGPEPERHRL